MRPVLQDQGEDTIVVASLGKAFGAGGGVAMLSNEKQKKLIFRYGGPSNWSKSLNAAAIGAGRASIQLHLNNEISKLQHKLQTNIQYFDSLLITEQAGSCAPIRLIRCANAAVANRAVAQLADCGFFTSTVFFPVVARDRPAIRITLRADMDRALIREFCTKVVHFLGDTPGSLQ